MRRMPAVPAHISRIGLAALACCGVLSASLADAIAKDVSVALDEAKLLPIDEPASEVIIGNPSIADVAVQSAKLLVITGKSFGTTNLIVLDSRGKEIFNHNVRVTSQEAQTVRMYKGGTRFSFDCAERCETMLVPGDNAEFTAAVVKGVRDKMGVAQSTIDGDPGAGQ